MSAAAAAEKRYKAVSGGARRLPGAAFLPDGGLPVGLLANTATILGVTLGKERPWVVGRSVRDRQGGPHAGIIQFPLPVLRGDRQGIKDLLAALEGPEYQGLTVLDFTDLAQRCKTYEEYIQKMGCAAPQELRYLGVLICGDKKQVTHLTGSLPLLR